MDSSSGGVVGQVVVVLGGGVMGRGIAAGFLAHGRSVVLLARSGATGDAAAALHARTLALAADVRAAVAAAVAATVVAAGADVAAADGAGPPVVAGAAADAGAASSAAAATAAEAPPASAPLRIGDPAAFDGWQQAALVIESVQEELALKRQLFAWLGERVPDGVAIGSNSSGFPISRIAEGLPTRRRMFNLHYFMPAHLVPLVEVVLGADSDAGLAQHVCALLAATGKTPVLVQRDIPGFLANRIQHALMREVLALIDAGIASPADIDTAVRHSFGFRYAAVGPVLQKEISGWDSMAQAAKEIYPTLSNATEPAPCLQRLLADGRLGMKSGAGFIDWTPEAAAAARAAYERRLAAALRLLRD